MSVIIEKHFLEVGKLRVEAFLFLPSAEKKNQRRAAIFTHGYTSHKGVLLTWASRMSEEGIATVIFDLPGHYLGSFNELESFEEFETNAHLLFLSARNLLEQRADLESPLWILGGHSLGALMSFKALNLDGFSDVEAVGVGVGFGHSALKEGKHLFATPFYKSTLNLRGQLVSPHLNPDKVFEWISDEKNHLSLTKKRLFLIAGLDDLVVGQDGPEILARELIEKGNDVTLERPAKLPHHLPEQAASFIKKALKAGGLL